MVTGESLIGDKHRPGVERKGRRRMSSKQAFSKLFFVCMFSLVLVTAACGGGDDGGPYTDGGAVSCTPGTPASCTCPNATAGTQTCNPDGTSYSECVCSGVGGGGGVSGGAGGGAGSTGGTAGTSSTARCGNGIIEGTEKCDGTQLNAQTCQTQGFSGGTLSCDPSTCVFNTGACQQMDGGAGDGGGKDAG